MLLLKKKKKNTKKQTNKQKQKERERVKRVYQNPPKTWMFENKAPKLFFISTLLMQCSRFDFVWYVSFEIESNFWFNKEI